MLAFFPSFLAIVAALVVPSIVGLFLISLPGRTLSPRYAAAFALGVFLWFFTDTMGDSANLDVSAGFGGGIEQIAVLVFFAAGLILMFSIDKSSFGHGQATNGSLLWVPLLVALGVGIHGFGEAAAFSATAASTTSANLFDAFGGASAAVAFILHKTLEPMMVGAAYLAYAPGRARTVASLGKDVVILALVFSLPGIVGGATNYFLNYDVTYAFALGLGTSIYAAAKLAGPLFSGTSDSAWGTTKLALLVLLGFLCLYLAALLHS